MNSHRIMKSAWALMVILALPLSPVNGAPRSEQRVVVVDLEDNAELGSGVAIALTDSVRGEVAELLGKRFTMVTKENINELVDEQTCIASGEASCAVETGRILGAHYIISGSLTKLGGKLNLALRVHETTTSKLLGVRQESAEGVERLQTRVLLRLARGACILIDPEVASRGDVLNAELKALEREAGMKVEAEDEDDLEAQLAALEQAEVEQGQVVRQRSDEEYLRDLKRIEQAAEEREAHERTASREWARVEVVAQKSATKGEVAVRLFLKKYGGHRLGNPMASEAQALLERVQRRQLEERKQRLSDSHLKVVKRAWRQARRVVLKGDEKAKRALELFLNAYADHPMGNPLESEAREAFAEAQLARQVRLKAEHLKRVTGDWKRAKRLVKRGDVKGKKALAMFLKKYASHELGNPLESEAQSTFDEAKAKRERKVKEVHEAQVQRAWGQIARVVKRGGKPAIKAVELFLKRFKGHPLGNPLESEAQSLYNEMRVELDKETHKAQLQITWDKLSQTAGIKNDHTVRALKSFITQYESHPLGNPFELQAEVLLASLHWPKSWPKPLTPVSSNSNSVSSNSNSSGVCRKDRTQLLDKSNIKPIGSLVAPACMHLWEPYRTKIDPRLQVRNLPWIVYLTGQAQFYQNITPSSPKVTLTDSKRSCSFPPYIVTASTKSSRGVMLHLGKAEDMRDADMIKPKPCGWVSIDQVITRSHPIKSADDSDMMGLLTQGAKWYNNPNTTGNSKEVPVGEINVAYVYKMKRVNQDVWFYVISDSLLNESRFKRAKKGWVLSSSLYKNGPINAVNWRRYNPVEKRLMYSSRFAAKRRDISSATIVNFDAVHQPIVLSKERPESACPRCVLVYIAPDSFGFIDLDQDEIGYFSLMSKSELSRLGDTIEEVVETGDRRSIIIAIKSTCTHSLNAPICSIVSQKVGVSIDELMKYSPNKVIKMINDPIFFDKVQQSARKALRNLERIGWSKHNFFKIGEIDYCWLRHDVLDLAAGIKELVAVVELDDNAQLGRGVAIALTNSVRGEVAELLGNRFTMITKENIYELVDEQTLISASVTNNVVKMGKLLGVHYIISGTLTKLEGKLNLVLRVHETKTSKLLGMREDSALNVDRLKVRVLPRLARGVSLLMSSP